MAQQFTVHDRLGPFTITGEILSESRFGSDRKPRWTDMALYRIVETQRDRWLTTRCTGCRPPRTLVTHVIERDEAPQTCEICHKPYKRYQGAFRYALEIIARSWVYHRFGSPCVKSRHKISTVGEISRSDGRWKNLLPCPVCNPGDLEELRDIDRIAEELPDYHVYLCSDARAIVRRLYHHSGELSELAVNLLQDAARQDPKIAAAIEGPRRI